MSQPIRMCVSCRIRALQSDLQRVQIINGKLVNFTKMGRSFYLCQACTTCENKKLIKMLNNKCKTNYKSLIEFGEFFKEMGSNG